MDKIVPQGVLSPNSQKKGKQVRSIAFTKSEFFSGPIPHPALLQGYEQACSGAAKRIIKMAESQLAHRHKIEEKVITSKTLNERTSMFLAFYLTGGLAIIGVILLLLDKQIPGYVSLFGPSFFHAGNYIYTKRTEKTEPKKTEEELKNAKKGNKKGKTVKRLAKKGRT